MYVVGGGGGGVDGSGARWTRRTAQGGTNMFGKPGAGPWVRRRWGRGMAASESSDRGAGHQD